MAVIGTHVIERHTLMATLIMSLEDSYARSRLGLHSHPRPMEPLRFWLIGYRVGGSLQPIAPPHELVVVRNPSGYHLFFGDQRLSDGSTRRLTLSAGTYVVRVTSSLYQAAEKDVALPMPNPNQPGIMDAYSLDLTPGYQYPFPDVNPARVQTQGNCSENPLPGRRGPTLLRGALRSTGGQGIAGALVQVPNRSNTYRTDDTGQWVLWFPDTHPTGPATVHIVYPDTTVVDVPGVCVIRGRETSLHETALRGWVQQSGVGVQGATITVTGHAGLTHCGTDGGWTYVLPMLQSDETIAVTASLPTGTQLTQSGIRIKSRATTLVPTFGFP